MTKFKSAFKESKSLDERKKESEKVQNTYSDKIAVIAEKLPNSSSDLPDKKKRKFLVPANMTIAGFTTSIRKRMNVGDDKAVYIFVNPDKPTLFNNSKTISQAYEEHKDEDGFLYLMYAGESSFGLQ
eukprot:CAMPEP_0113879588 /NCGR_PEP_ID=MMETSP0780_2-20120614/7318_1 /TAXON_ID=652834 /ORGANISM="Palpitomonas bilix" /LENGTH=126 /DNA_ID=CAMNT_0000866179 /DNA_START=114 /DNA_END=495 /DNA_ORIENTATION=- /assembly_acc=CAM_ASM_000599